MMNISLQDYPDKGAMNHSDPYPANDDTEGAGVPEHLIITQYKDMKPEAISLSSKAFSPRNITDKISSHLTKKIGNGKVRVHCYTPLDTPAYLMGDPHIIEQILLRLADNALKHTAEGEIYVGCEIVEMYGDAELAIMRFEVRDTGTGIMTENLKELTTSASQHTDDGKICQPQQKGQGLDVVKKLTKLMGGQVYIESAYTLGSRFWFEIPLGMKNNTDTNTITQGSNQLGGRYVLIITQSETSQFILKNYLKAWDSRPIVATDQDEAMLMLRNSLALNEPFYAIIIDMDEAEKNQNFIKVIRSKRRHDSVPIIVVDTKNTTYDQVTASIPAPVTSKQLYHLLNHSIKQLQNRMALPFSAKPPEIKILLVENNKLDATITTIILENLEAEIHHIRDETQIIQQIIDNAYHLILISIPIAEKGFYNTRIIQAVRTWEEHTVQERLPIIAMAPYIPGIKPAELIKKAGANDYIAKPIRKDEMLEVTRNWLASTENTGQSATCYTKSAKQPAKHKIEGTGRTEPSMTV